MKQNGIKMIKWWRLETSGKFVNTFIFFLGLHGHEGNWQGRARPRAARRGWPGWVAAAHSAHCVLAHAQVLDYSFLQSIQPPQVLQRCAIHSGI
jgi:hypothetical protein